MFNLRMNLILILLAGLMSAYVSAAEPKEEENENSLALAKVEAAEKEALTTSEQEDALRKMFDAPAGVFAPEYDEDGILLRLKIKGEAEVTTGFHRVRGDRLARERADRLAKAAFVKFLKEEVSVRENDMEEVIIVEKDGEEQAGYKNVSTRVIETRAQGLLRGLIVLVDQIEGEGRDRKAVVVFGWSKKLADAARTAQAEMARERNPVSRPATGNRGGNSGSSGTRTRAAENLNDF